MCWRENIPPRGSSRAVIEYLMGTCLQALRDDNYILRVTDRSAECPYRYDTHGLHSWSVFFVCWGGGIFMMYTTGLALIITHTRQSINLPGTKCRLLYSRRTH